MFEVINMPANYEMVIPHSPPVFSHSPPAGFLTNVNSGYPRHYDPLRAFCRPQSISQQQQQKKPLSLHIKRTASPKRSCLVHRSTPCSPDDQIDAPDFLESTNTESPDHLMYVLNYILFFFIKF